MKWEKKEKNSTLQRSQMDSAVQLPGWGEGRESRSDFLEVIQMENEQSESLASPQASHA